MAAAAAAAAPTRRRKPKTPTEWLDTWIGLPVPVEKWAEDKRKTDIWDQESGRGEGLVRVFDENDGDEDKEGDLWKKGSVGEFGKYLSKNLSEFSDTNVIIIKSTREKRWWIYKRRRHTVDDDRWEDQFESYGNLLQDEVKKYIRRERQAREIAESNVREERPTEPDTPPPSPRSGGGKYKYIVNPITNRRVKTNGKLGRNTIRKYLNTLRS